MIDWTSFSIGRGNTVTFNNGSGATLNRVTAGAPSALLGSLNATGSVYLINPQGIVVGHSGVISTGGRFVASTLDLPDTAFMNGGPLTFSGTSNGKVVNLGKVSSSGGDVFLIARDVVVNDGVVSAPNGTAEYVVGQQVLLSDSSSSSQLFVQTGSKGTVIDRGTTLAAQINLEAADGNIYALAGGGSRIRATGTATRDGHIWLVADSGHVTQHGTVAATNQDGSGGTVDTLANTLTLAHGAGVQAGLWNVSTPNFTIDRSTAAAFVRSLYAGTSIDASATGTNGASGDMTVASNLVWQGPASLSLAAYRNITIAPTTTLRNTGSGNLSLRADATGIDNASSVVNQGKIDWSGSTGLVSAFYDMNGSYSSGTVLSNRTWAAPEDSGLVSQFTPYKLVNSFSDLGSIANDFAGIYALGKDVNARTPPGTTSSSILTFPLTPFVGQLDGMGHTISNLSMSASGNFGAPVGMFPVIGAAGVVRNLILQATISGAATNYYYGLLAAISEGTIARVRTGGEIALTEGQAVAVGGLVGSSTGTITRSASSAGVLCTCFSASASYTGGLVGYNGGVIRQSYAATFTSGNGAGGLVGLNDGLVTQSYAIGTVTANGGPVGALIGGNRGTVEQSFATALVQTPRGGGGIAATNIGTGSIAHNVFWDIQATGTDVAVTSVADFGSPGNAQSLTTEQMGMPASFGPTFDFGPNGAWIMFPGASHPALRWQQFGP
ncbi:MULTISPECIES: filamentous hemagglutinin N-terminal domain-containing protein [unclassified Paraburkholderia]|uniref:two-partner secretion domain-containing protein n=1 Tax=unclassified Paraburkholderia TaxID=2615204 RepID=UPI00182A6AB2|nr:MULTISPECIES: filamentous hemagglutinin N-terminal domain-containing protein [unclassified Paraburkholderia]MBB5445111.1 filamentous hemagglutinin family protein [Paraburkholderia sp. WSM4177]MBB5484042.1 filamentous hemagglutinin family protein [Paraburkholderia sp. WSM4180]